MVATRNIELLTFDELFMYIKVKGETFKVAIAKASPKLAKASEEERNCYRFSPSGYGIHWQLLDEDLSVSHLLEIAE